MTELVDAHALLTPLFHTIIAGVAVGAAMILTALYFAERK